MLAITSALCDMPRRRDSCSMREHDAAQRRVEGRGDAGRRAGDHQVMGIDARLRRQPAPGMRHDAGADLHRRPFAPDRQPGQQPAGDEPDLVQRHAQRHQPAALLRVQLIVERAHHLRDARAGGAGREAACPPEHRHRQQRCPQQRQVLGVGPAAARLSKPSLAASASSVKPDHDQARGGRIGEHHGAVEPLPAAAHFVLQVAPELGLEPSQRRPSCPRGIAPRAQPREQPRPRTMRWFGGRGAVHWLAWMRVAARPGVYIWASGMPAARSST